MVNIYDRQGWCQSYFNDTGDENKVMLAVVKRQLKLILKNIDQIHMILKSIEELTPELPPDLQPPEDFPKHLIKRR